MNIEINVADITLATVVAAGFRYDGDGEEYPAEQTVGDLVAAQIVERLVQDDRWPSLRDRVTQIRNEEIRAAVRPAIDEALARPIHKTNGYGERVGTETKTLAEVIADEARRQLTEPADRYRSEKGSILQQTVRDEVKRAFTAEIAATVQKARDLVTKEMGDQIAQQVTAAVAAGLAKR
ncbi:hypothetical protein ACFWA6_18280 [Streptomyces sp. NPDC060020]|uniref:hypothetical protein n=1 Tax=Streptomyces sp. NPDC060020 TaxID=3347038 RepID=UPI003687B901